MQLKLLNFVHEVLPFTLPKPLLEKAQNTTSHTFIEGHLAHAWQLRHYYDSILSQVHIPGGACASPFVSSIMRKSHMCIQLKNGITHVCNIFSLCVLSTRSSPRNPKFQNFRAMGETVLNVWFQFVHVYNSDNMTQGPHISNVYNIMWTALLLDICMHVISFLLVSVIV